MIKIHLPFTTFITRIQFIAVFVSLFICSCASAPKSLQDSENLIPALHKAAVEAEKTYNYTSATNLYRSLKSTSPEDILFTLGLARNLRYSGDSAQSIIILTESIKKISDQNHSTEKSQLLAELGKAYIANKHTEKAIKVLVEAVELVPNRWDLYSALGIAYDFQNMPDTAQKNYLKALECSPNNYDVINNFALSLASAGKLDEAITMLERIAQSIRSTVQQRQNLAMLKALKGSSSEAEYLIRKDLPKSMADKNTAIYKRMMR